MRLRQYEYVREILYTLKQEYGSPVDIYITGTTIFDTESGLAIIPRTKIHIKKAIILPIILQVRSSVLRAMGVNYNNTLDVAAAMVIVESKDLNDVKVELNNVMVINSRPFFIDKYELLEHKLAYLITGKETKEQKPYQILDLQASNKLKLGTSNGIVF